MTSEFQAVMTGPPEQRIEALRSHLGYPVKQLDPGGSRFWYLRPGVDAEEAEYTCPIAVGFYTELDDSSSSDILRFLTSDNQQQEIYGHYINRVIPEQPVMYLLLPDGEQQGLVAMILPTETKLRQRQIQIFDWQSEDLQARLKRLNQETLARTDRIQETAISVVPLVEWAFYKPITTAKDLAQKLAVVSRRIEQAIPEVYKAEGDDGYLHNLLLSFQRELLPNLKLEAQNTKDYSFSDIYAQTIAYGLFTARVFSYTTDERQQREGEIKRKETDFNRQNAWDLLPETNPFLRRLFRDVSEKSIKKPEDELGDAIADELGDAISEVFSILRAAKMEAILEDFRSKMNREDIVIRFYEDFLASYKPEMREGRGVYYTPEPVVSYMVRSVDILLKEKFNKPLGLADPEVMILDPACGTGTFLLWIFQLIHQRFEESPETLTEGLEDKSWSGYVKERLLPRIFGFELLMAPYAISHLKLGLFLEETGYQFNSGKRLGVFLTNTLEEASKKTETLLEEFIAYEADQAFEIKQEMPIMVVIGNPPYSVSSSNKGAYIDSLVSRYKKSVKKEKNIQPLSDDYIKFIAFAHSKIESTGHGICALISNHGYLGGPIHRGLRDELRKTFNLMYFFDLFGSLLQRRKTESTVDENVFDIQQGVAISFLLKEINRSKNLESRSFYFGVRGTRNKKYDLLNYKNINDSDFQPIKPNNPYYFFEPKDLDLKEEYDLFFSVEDIFLINSSGFTTHRDQLVIDISKDKLKKRINDLSNPKLSNENIYSKYNLHDNRDWSLGKCRLSLYEQKERLNVFYKKCLYRPFDTRNIFYNSSCIDFPRNNMVHMLSPNIAIATSKIRTSDNFDAALVTNLISETKAVESTRRTYIFPLYSYPTTEIEKGIGISKSTNFSNKFLSAVKKKLGFRVEAENLFYYIYAILYSPAYRHRYSEFLKIEFPRIPVSSDPDLFKQLAVYGEEMVSLHLLKSEKLDVLISQFEGNNDYVIAPGYPKYADNKVTINKNNNGFAGVPDEVWNFYIGGYQVCHKWLKDRKGRTLSNDDILHYQRIIVALKETITLMQKIDEAIPSWPIE